MQIESGAGDGCTQRLQLGSGAACRTGVGIVKVRDSCALAGDDAGCDGVRAPIAGATLNLHLDPSSEPVFFECVRRPSVRTSKQKFTVPSGAQHLDAAIAFQVSAEHQTVGERQTHLGHHQRDQYGSNRPGVFLPTRVSPKLGVMSLPGGLCAASSTLPGTGDCYKRSSRGQDRRVYCGINGADSNGCVQPRGLQRGRYGKSRYPLRRTSRPNTVLASLTEPEIPYGLWIVIPALIGPYGPAGAPTTPVTTSAFAVMKPFDAPWRRTVATIGQI